MTCRRGSRERQVLRPQASPLGGAAASSLRVDDRRRRRTLYGAVATTRVDGQLVDTRGAGLAAVRSGRTSEAVAAAWGSPIRFSSRALTATTMLEPDIDRAAISGR